MGWGDVANAVSSRILSEPREGRSRGQRCDNGRIVPLPVFAQSFVVFSVRKSWPRGARGYRLQLLLGFCIDLFSENAVATRPTPAHLSITPSLDSLTRSAIPGV